MQSFMFMLLLLGASVESDPKAPAPAQVTKYAMADADHMVFVNLRSILPPTLKSARDLSNHPLFKDIPELDESVRQMMSQLEMGISMVKGRFGVHPVEDLHWVAGYVRYASESRPELLFVLEGNFGPETVESIAKATDEELERLDGRPLIVDDRMALGLSKDGHAIFGTEALVRERVADGYKPAKAKKGSAVAGAQKHLKSKPFMLVSAAPSPEANGLFTRKLRSGGEMMGLIRDLLMSHKQAVIAIGTTSLTWEWTSPTKEGAERVELASNGNGGADASGDPRRPRFRPPGDRGAGQLQERADRRGGAETQGVPVEPGGRHRGYGQVHKLGQAQGPGRQGGEQGRRPGGDGPVRRAGPGGRDGGVVWSVGDARGRVPGAGASAAVGRCGGWRGALRFAAAVDGCGPGASAHPPQRAVVTSAGGRRASIDTSGARVR